MPYQLSKCILPFSDSSRCIFILKETLYMNSLLDIHFTPLTPGDYKLVAVKDSGYLRHSETDQ